MMCVRKRGSVIQSDMRVAGMREEHAKDRVKWMVDPIQLGEKAKENKTEEKEYIGIIEMRLEYEIYPAVDV